jgi:hypothetical protein
LYRGPAWSSWLSPVFLANTLTSLNDLLHHRVTREHTERPLPVVPARLRRRRVGLQQLIYQLLKSSDSFFNRGLRHICSPRSRLTNHHHNLTPSPEQRIQLVVKRALHIARLDAMRDGGGPHYFNIRLAVLPSRPRDARKGDFAGCQPMCDRALQRAATWQ